MRITPWMFSSLFKGKSNKLMSLVEYIKEKYDVLDWGKLGDDFHEDD
jgi:hypothetical protein